MAAWRSFSIHNGRSHDDLTVDQLHALVDEPTQVEHLVEPGELEPDLVHTPSVYVKRIFQGELYEKRIERRTVRKS